MITTSGTRATFGALLVTLAVCACGGGGGGGGSTVAAGPTAPPPPVGPGPSTGSAGEQTLFGQVEGLFDPSASFSGSRIRVVGVAEDTIRTDNSFFLDPVPPGRYVLAVNGSALLDRKVEIEMRSGGANEIARLDLVEAESFNLAAFDEIYRSGGDRGTARFVTRPDFFIDDTSFNRLSGGNGARLRADVEMAITGPMRRAVGPLFAGVRVQTRALQQQDWESPCDLPENHAYWYADRDLRDDDGQRLLGRAWWCWFPTLNRVRGGLLWLDATAGPGTVLHELVHMLGTADHLETAPGTSVISSPRLTTVLTDMDERHLTFLYARPPGLMSPDDASGLGLSGLSSLATGGGMETRCSIYPDGRVLLERGPAGSFAPRR